MCVCTSVVCMHVQWYAHVHSPVFISIIQTEEESFLVRLYDSDVEEPSSMDRLYVCFSDRFLEERNFGSGKVRSY